MTIQEAIHGVFRRVAVAAFRPQRSAAFPDNPDSLLEFLLGRRRRAPRRWHRHTAALHHRRGRRHRPCRDTMHARCWSIWKSTRSSGCCFRLSWRPSSRSIQRSERFESVHRRMELVEHRTRGDPPSRSCDFSRHRVRNRRAGERRSTWPRPVITCHLCRVRRPRRARRFTTSDSRDGGVD